MYNKGTKVTCIKDLPSHYNDRPQVGAVYTVDYIDENEDAGVEWEGGTWLGLIETDNRYPATYFRLKQSIRRK